MIDKKLIATLSVFVLVAGSLARTVSAADTKSADDKAGVPKEPIGLFQAMDDNQVDVKFLAKNDHDAHILVKNNTDQPLTLKIPDAFAAVPALAQFGGGGGRGGGGGGPARGGGGGSTGGGGHSKVSAVVAVVVGESAVVAVVAAAIQRPAPKKPRRSIWQSFASNTACAILPSAAYKIVPAE